jgi:quinol monooxygenase YgiN
MNPRNLTLLIAGTLTLSLGCETNMAKPVPNDTPFYSVSYVEVSLAARAAAIHALQTYRDASHGDQGFVRMEFFEQIGRLGHFAIVETWADQKAFDSHTTVAHTAAFRSALDNTRLSDYDERPYRPVSAGATTAAPTSNAIYVLTHVDTVNPSNGADLLRRLATESRKDEGCLRFDVLQHATKENHFTIVETWRSLKAFENHAAVAHTRIYRDGLHSISGSPLDERIYKPVP